jgi:DeoR family fructose operon transcriptional repressor
MFPAERRRKMLTIVQQRGTVKIAELSEMFDVSEMTIHRDLSKLQATGLLEKSYGGVVATHSLTVEPDFAARSKTAVEEKADIGRAAAEFVSDGDCILVDASTTCLAMVRHLKSRKRLTVFTTGLYPAVELASADDVTVHVSGGVLSRETLSFVGPHTNEFLDRIHVDKCFIGTNSVDVNSGLTDPYLLEAEVKRSSVAIADQVFLLADHSKFGRISMIQSVALPHVDLIITDGRQPNTYLSKLSEAGVPYKVAPISGV